MFITRDEGESEDENENILMNINHKSQKSNRQNAKGIPSILNGQCDLFFITHTYLFFLCIN
jgi:hypothetical protein